MMKRLVVGMILGVALLPFAANAQFNVDVNGIDFGTPANSYGAASGQAGFWNAVNFSGGATPLSNLAGGATGATVNVSTGATFSFDNLGTFGDDQALMDDLFDLGSLGSTTVTFNGIAPGNYDVYTYAWAPDSETFLQSVSVAGSPKGPVGTGGPWIPGFEPGITHAVHEVAVGGSGQITINVNGTSGFASLNGVQIVPEPATLGLLALGGLAAIRRRRR